MSTTATAIEAKERPILFSGPMVRAILEGRKSQTRRVIRVREGEDFCALNGLGRAVFTVDQIKYREVKCRYGVKGDRLWVRETFLIVGCEADHRIVYKSSNDGPDEWVSPAWRPSIFMPRWASRITLEVTDVRVERLQDIPVEDAQCEGIEIEQVEQSAGEQWLEKTLCHFIAGWDALNAKRGYPWESNPWVWAITFRKLAGTA